MAGLKYRKIHKYQIMAECTAPLHIGSAAGEKSEVLVHPVTALPFIQASSIAGVLRGVSDRVNGDSITGRLFGASRLKEGSNASDFASRLKVSDGRFLSEKTKMELRPRVAINPETGSVGKSTIKGSGAAAGHKFEMESISAGEQFAFELYLFDDEGKEVLERVLCELKGDYFQIGGQKSNGEGYIALKKLLYKCFDMADAGDRKLWAVEDTLEEKVYQNLTNAIGESGESLMAYEISIKGRTEGSLLVKSIAVTEGFGEGFPDAVNIKNGSKEYIIPGSSLKGAIRSQLTRVAEQMGVKSVVPAIFGSTGNAQNRGKAGCVQVSDTVVGTAYDNDRAEIQHHIHLDKFTGGVMNGGLFTERNVCGDLTMRISITKAAEASLAAGLIILTARDLAAGLMNVGSGYATGKGFIDVESIEVRSSDRRQAVISFAQGQICDPEGLIDECLTAIARYRKDR